MIGQTLLHCETLEKLGEGGLCAEAVSDLIESIEKQFVRLTLEGAGGNVSQAASLLGIERNTIRPD